MPRRKCFGTKRTFKSLLKQNVDQDGTRSLISSEKTAEMEYKLVIFKGSSLQILAKMCSPMVLGVAIKLLH